MKRFAQVDEAQQHAVILERVCVIKFDLYKYRKMA